MKVEYTVLEVNQLLISSDTAFCVPVYMLLIPYDFQICCAQIFSKKPHFFQFDSLCPFLYASVYLRTKLKCAV